MVDLASGNSGIDIDAKLIRDTKLELIMVELTLGKVVDLK